MKIGQAVSEKKTFKGYEILYMYIAQGQRQITLEDKILIVTGGFATLIIHCKFQALVFNTFCETEFSIFFTHTNAYRRKFDYAVQRSNVNLGSSFEQTWITLSPRCSVTRFSLEAFLVLEKKIFKCFSLNGHIISYMGMAAIFFNDAERFEQIYNTPLIEGPT